MFKNFFKSAPEPESSPEPEPVQDDSEELAKDIRNGILCGKNVMDAVRKKDRGLYAISRMGAAEILSERGRQIYLEYLRQHLEEYRHLLKK